MRTSTYLTAAFAATAIAVPLNDKRVVDVVDVVTKVDVVYVTDIITETAGAPRASHYATSSAAAAASSAAAHHWGHHPHHHSHASVASSSEAASSTHVASSSTHVASTSVYVAPSSTYVAPSSTSVAPATSAAPTTSALSSYEVSKSWLRDLHKHFPFRKHEHETPAQKKAEEAKVKAEEAKIKAEIAAIKKAVAAKASASKVAAQKAAASKSAAEKAAAAKAASSSSHKSSTTTTKHTTTVTSTVKKVTTTTTAHPTSTHTPTTTTTTHKTTTTTTKKPTTTTHKTTTTTKKTTTTTKKTTAKSSTKKATSTTNYATITGGSVGSAAYTHALVVQHNAHRSNHSAPSVTYDAKLASIASEIAASCTYAHNTAAGGGGYGQNIAAGTTAEQVGQIITNEMYNGEINWFDGLYGEANPDMTNFDSWGHFSQIVWKSTTGVGCWTQQCSKLYNSDGSQMASDIPPYFTVCNYGPPGNYAGEYGDNIAKPLGHAAYLVS